ncbi:MAG: aspartyl protease family protein [Candidatus Obscuribacterales bacterium]|nr:aspartyl protease family protein [Candidatus Obscuribacterales bacterium]
MRRPIIATSLVMALVSSSSGTAWAQTTAVQQQSTPDQQQQNGGDQLTPALQLNLPTAQEVMQQEPDSIDVLVPKVLKAYGGIDQLKQWDTGYALAGKQHVKSASGASNTFAFRQYSKGRKLRIEMRLGEADTLTVYDGKKGWRQQGGQTIELPVRDLKLLHEEADHQLSLLSHWMDPDYHFRLVGRTYFHQVPVMAIEIEKPGSAVVTCFVNPDNNLVIGLAYDTVDPELGTIARVEDDLLMYKPVGETMVPFQHRQQINKQLAFDLNIDEFAFNTRLEDELFTAPQQMEAVHLSQPVTVPFDYYGGEIITKVRINGGEDLDFLVDTGCGQTIIDRKIGAEFLLQKVGQLTVTGASGNLSVATSRVKKLDIGSASLAEVPVSILDLTPQSRRIGRRLAGVLGSNVLSRFAVSIDYGSKAMTLYEAGTVQPAAGAIVVPFAMRQGPVVKGIVDGKFEVQFLIDTGSTFNHLPPNVAKQLASTRVEQTIDAAGLDGNTVKLNAITVESVALGNEIARKIRFAYAADPASATEAKALVRVANMGILGNPFFENYLPVIDFKSQLIFLKGDAKRKSRQEMEALISAGDANLIIDRNYRQAENDYVQVVRIAQRDKDLKEQAIALGRLGNMRRVMSKDLKRPEQGQAAYQYFTKAIGIARQIGDKAVEGRIMADWSLLYSDLGQPMEAKKTIEAGLMLAPNDAQVNVDAAVHYYRSAMYADMRRHVDRALVLEPTNWQALWYKVRLLELYNDVGREHDTLKEILRYYPSSFLAKEKLGKLGD